ncbi:MAG: hypothetical protein NT038_07995 [Euryarchaeota archaeon]|nr:hypothetical protein [Euryarchaeota archaeon]
MGKDANNVKGRLGEYIFAYNTNKTLRKYGYIQSFKSIPNSYTLRHYYRGQKGIDYYLRITDSNNNIYKYLIEVANWKKLRYQMNYFYKTRLVSKFYTWDRLNRYQHVIAINHRNISYIEEQLKNDKVLVIKFKEHYTPELIKKIVERKEIDISPYSINYPI